MHGRLLHVPERPGLPMSLPRTQDGRDSSVPVELRPLTGLMEECPIRDRHLIAGEKALNLVSATGHADVDVDGPPLWLRPDRIPLMSCSEEYAVAGFAICPRWWLKCRACRRAVEASSRRTRKPWVEDSARSGPQALCGLAVLWHVLTVGIGIVAS